MRDSKKRSFAKTITWRITATLTTIILVYILGGNLMLALSVGFIEVFAKLLIYYLHERLWDNISMGKEYHPLSKINVKKSLNLDDETIIKKKLSELGYL